MIEHEPPSARAIRKVLLEFKVTGLSCANCTGAVEKAVVKAFDLNELFSVQVILLTHKMRCTVLAQAYLSLKITPEKICEIV